MQALVREVLAAWREAERVAMEHPTGSPEHAAAIRAARRLQGLYRDLTADAPTIDADAVQVALARTRLTEEHRTGA